MVSRILISSFIFMIFMGVARGSDKDILIVTEEWPPYNFLKDGTLKGFSTELVQQLLAVIDKDYEILLLPSARSVAALNKRPRTLMFSMFRTPKRESQYKWIGPLGDASIHFYKQKDNNIQVKSLSDIKNTKQIICTRQTGIVHDLLIKKGFHNIDAPENKSLPIYQKLLLGRCDLSISDSDLGVRYILKSLNVSLDDVFEKIPIPIFEAQFYIAASKDISDEEIKQWQSALDMIKSNGVYDGIFQKYH